MANEVDISERGILRNFSQKVLKILLKDHATEENIYWATDDYLGRGPSGFGYFDPITVELIRDDTVILPRVSKSADEQSRRVKEKAEVFTPVWVCNLQNNLVDEVWFGRADVFNTMTIDDTGAHVWQRTPGKVSFPRVKGRDWQSYIKSPRLELACGEAPYLTSRYDVVSGTAIPIEERFGVLDRKLRIVTEHTHTPKSWLLYALQALKATYGFEWQGDNLLLAREALLMTFTENFHHAFPKEPGVEIRRADYTQAVQDAAKIISCNLWQMDGLNYVLPKTASTPFRKWRYELTNDLFSETPPAPLKPANVREKAAGLLPLLREGKHLPHNGTGIPAVIYEWFPYRKKYFFAEIAETHRKTRPPSR